MNTLLRRASDVISELNQVLRDEGVDSTDIRGYIVRIETVVAYLRRVVQAHQANNYLVRLTNSLEQVCHSLRSIDSGYDLTGQTHISATHEHTGQRGRPSLVIGRQQIDFLISHQFSVRHVAQLFGVSLSTIRRRMSTYGISVTSRYSNVGDQQLDVLVSNIVHGHPHAGYRMVGAYLLSRGFKITERRVRSSLRRVDPLGVAVRWSRHRCIHRRIYSVPHPNALWHIDGNMSLVRWKLVVHGGIDGYSRVITYLRCSTNNSALTVLSHFVNAVRLFGCPSRVRSDHGGENLEVAKFMILARGSNRGSHITGQSTRNQRIERLWRDVFENCLHLFYSLFYMMEDNGILDPDNELHLLALHHVYLPRIQKSLLSFQEAWNCHGMRTVQSESPMQQWIRGMLLHRMDYSAVNEVFARGNSMLHSVSMSTREDVIMQLLYQFVDPLSPSDVWGVDLYTDTLQVLYAHVRSH